MREIDRYEQLPLDALRESGTNPRRRFTDLEGLADSIRQVGILEPLLVRPLNGHHEIIAGARRYRAAQLAGLDRVPCIVRALDDQAAREAQIIENLQRQDIHPLDEADGYRALLAADGAYTVEAIAAKVGKSASYVRHRLKLGALVPIVRTAFEADRITAAHALVIARLPPKLQAEALHDGCFYQMFRGGVDDEILNPVRQLEEWVSDHVPVDPRAPETAELFPEVAAAVAEATAAGDALVPITRQWNVRNLHPPPLTSDHWREAKGKKPCSHVKTGVIVVGEGRAALLRICTTKTCAKHWPERQTTTGQAGHAPTRELSEWERKARKAQRERREAAQFARVKGIALHQLLEKVADRPVNDAIVRWAIEKLSPVSALGTAALDQALGARHTWTVDRFAALLHWSHALEHAWTAQSQMAALKKHGINVKALLAARASAKATTAAKARGAAKTPKKARKAR